MNDCYAGRNNKEKFPLSRVYGNNYLDVNKLINKVVYYKDDQKCSHT